MSTIRETALAAVGGRVPRGSGATAEAAVGALVAREQAMFDQIVEAGTALGARRDQVHDILVDAGMTAPAVVESTPDAEGVVGRLERLEAKVDAAIAEGRRRLARRGR